MYCFDLSHQLTINVQTTSRIDNKYINNCIFCINQRLLDNRHRLLISITGTPLCVD